MTIAITQQQSWMAALALSSLPLLEEGWERLAAKPRYKMLRPVEIGMVLLRARIGGTGAPFNFGEATMTRAAVELDGGERGFSYLLGRKPREAELSAAFHALLQCPERRAEVEDLVIRPAEAARAAAMAADRSAAAATRVDFSALVRGHD